MKLFKSLLVAPATLGLLAPVAATANEVTINDFNPAEEIAVTNSRVDGIEARLNNFEAGSFSETTSASFGSTFYVGSVDAGADEGVTTFSYDFALDLNTSFTGEDSLDVAIIGGNANETEVDDYMGGDGTGDALTLDGVAYTFPVGGFTITAGDGVGVDDLNTGACAYSAFTDLLSDCGTSSVGGSADSAVAASYDFGNGFTIAAGIGGGGVTPEATTQGTATTGTVTGAAIAAELELTGTEAGGDLAIAGTTTGAGAAATEDTVAITTTVEDDTTTAADPMGLLSDQDPSTLGLELAYTTDTFGVSAAYTDNDDASGVDAGTYYSFQAAYTPDAPFSISGGMEFDEDDASSYFVGLSSEVGVGSLSVGMATKGLAADHADNLQYEVAYSYPVNDGMTVTPGLFLSESNVAGTDDEFGVVVTTSFSF